MLLRLLSFLKIVDDEFSDIVNDAELYADKIRLILVDNSWIEVRYPVENKFSFHWQRGRAIYRIDTAPHHKELSTYPKHIHFGSEGNIIEDKVTGESNIPEERFRNFMLWVKETV